MTFRLSQRSKDRMSGVDPRLIAIANYAITATRIDFGVTQGLRTYEMQEQLFNSGASQTMQSKHLDGRAIDVVAYISGRVSWELNLYDDIADAFKEGAEVIGVPIRWGAAWNVEDLRLWEGTMEEAMNGYIDLRRSQGRRPFIDGPHFELMD